MAEDGRHVVVMTCNSEDRPKLLREVANGCTQLLLDVRDQLTDRQTVIVESVDVVTAHGMHGVVALVPTLMPVLAGQTTAVVITALVKTKPEATPEPATSPDDEGGASRTPG